MSPPVIDIAPTASALPARREKEILLAALAKDLLDASGQETVRIEDELSAIVVSRVKMPVRVDGKPSQCTPEYAAELQKRLEKLDQSKPLFEFEIETDVNQSASRP